ncbi:21013_t:CDS:2 [Entrophospora sp. SA101]|nr:21013_t:CDS:2 [Entrophospora sp. SA101]
MVRLTKQLAEKFYQEHSTKPFFGGMIDFMCSSPVVVICLEGENAIKLNREIMGATDPKQAEEGTIRGIYGDNIDNNVVHGSDRRNANIYFPEETYNKLRQVSGPKISRFVSEVVEEKL